MFFTFYASLLFIYFVIPFAVFQIMPGRKSLFITMMVMVLFYVIQLDEMNNWDINDRLGAGELFARIVPVSLGMGLFFRCWVLNRRRTKRSLPRPPWTWRDKAVLGTVFSIVIVSQIYGASGVCARNFHKFEKDELVARILVGDEWYALTNVQRAETLKQRLEGVSGQERLLEYYRINNARPSMLGQHRMDVTLFYEQSGSGDEYRDITYAVNACGERAGDDWRMGSSRAEFQRGMKYNKNIRDYIALLERP